MTTASRAGRVSALEEWWGIVKAFDIATGYFEIGALLALDGKGQPLERIWILMGAETTYRTRKALVLQVRTLRDAARRARLEVTYENHVLSRHHGQPIRR